eukprot:scaffold2914_cov178-Amphora_coffeaeformis.AAC.14
MMNDTSEGSRLCFEVHILRLKLPLHRIVANCPAYVCKQAKFKQDRILTCFDDDSGTLDAPSLRTLGPRHKLRKFG